MRLHCSANVLDILLNMLIIPEPQMDALKHEASTNSTRGAEVDARGCAVSGASSAALDAFEHALALAQSWRSGADTAIGPALQEAPAFVMAHVLHAYLHLSSRDPQRVAGALPILQRASGLQTNQRERMHLAAIGAALSDNYEGARQLLLDLLHLYPRDVLALQVGHMLDYALGDVVQLGERVAGVMPAWSDQLPGYHAVLSMRAFGLVESGEYDHAEDAASAALALNPLDARAHHAMAHVFEMSERPEAGVRWLGRHSESWGSQTVVATHCWWHVALFHLAQGRTDMALRVYDQRIRAGYSTAIAELIDAAALLWRVKLRGANAGARWTELANAWAPHIDDRFCSFNDLHAMLALVGAGDGDRAYRLERVLAECQALDTRHGATTRMLGLPACRALMAFGRGDDTLALTLLASLPAQAHRFGGSHAQRDVLHLTMLQTVERLRRPRRNTTPALAPALAVPL
jgi:tetratricopeptide (TPR) repeat protein